MYKLIDSLGGRVGKKCYYVLVLAADEMNRHYPDRPPVMETIYSSVAQKIGSNEVAVSRAVARAVIDIWEYGDHEKLEHIVGRKLIEKPAPKDFLVWLAHYAHSPRRTTIPTRI